MICAGVGLALVRWPRRNGDHAILILPGIETLNKDVFRLQLLRLSGCLLLEVVHHLLQLSILFGQSLILNVHPFLFCRVLLFKHVDLDVLVVDNHFHVSNLIFGFLTTLFLLPLFLLASNALSASGLLRRLHPLDLALSLREALLKLTDLFRLGGDQPSLLRIFLWWLRLRWLWSNLTLLLDGIENRENGILNLVLRILGLVQTRLESLHLVKHRCLVLRARFTLFSSLTLEVD